MSCASRVSNASAAQHVLNRVQQSVRRRRGKPSPGSRSRAVSNRARRLTASSVHPLRQSHVRLVQCLRATDGLAAATKTASWNRKAGTAPQTSSMNRNCTLVELRVELRGFEPPGSTAEMRSELQVRSVSFQFSPARYLRFRFRVLTASRAADSVRSLINAVASTASMSASRLLRAAPVGGDVPERHVHGEFDRSGACAWSAPSAVRLAAHSSRSMRARPGRHRRRVRHCRA